MHKPNVVLKFCAPAFNVTACMKQSTSASSDTTWLPLNNSSVLNKFDVKHSKHQAGCLNATLFSGNNRSGVHAEFLQYFILYLSHTVRTTVKLYFDQTVAKDKLS